MSEEVKDIVTPQTDDQKKESMILRLKEKIRLARREQIKKLILVAFMLAGFTVGMVFVFRAFGINIFDAESSAPGSGDSRFATLAILFIVLYFIQAMTLNLIPGTTTVFVSGIAFTMLGGQDNIFAIYGVVVAAVLLASIGLYFLGRYGGRKLLYWLFSKDTLDKRLDWFARNGSRGVPWLFLIPMFPTDLMCVTCGAAKMKFWQYVLIVFVFRPVEIALLLLYPIILGSDVFQQMDTVTQILVVNVLLINIVLLMVYHRTILNIFNKTFNIKKREEQMLHAMMAAEQMREMEQERAEQLRREADETNKETSGVK
ncbi:MAG: VTT domain-containing protein [Firmicutes bacterium]|nr:VTT domain-containing protein [Bacillota bacterium]